MGKPVEQAEARPAAIGAILAGGLGSRLGGGKATVDLDGRPLISYPIEAVREAALEPLVVAKAGSDIPTVDCPVLREPDEPRHPLCGIVTALRHARRRPVVAVGCDMPLLSPALLSWLAFRAEPLIVPSVGGRLQPLPGRYSEALLPALDLALTEARPLGRTVESLRPLIIGEAQLARFGDPDRLCFNVNATADLELAERLLAPPTP